MLKHSQESGLCRPFFNMKCKKCFQQGEISYLRCTTCYCPYKNRIHKIECKSESCDAEILNMHLHDSLQSKIGTKPKRPACLHDVCPHLQRLLQRPGVVKAALELLTRVVDADLQVDFVEDFSHFSLQAVQLSSFSLQLPLVLLVA